MSETERFPAASQFRRILVVADEMAHAWMWSEAILAATREHSPRVVPVLCSSLEQAVQEVRDTGDRLLGLIYDHSNGGPLELERFATLQEHAAWRIVRRAGSSPQVTATQRVRQGINRVINGTHGVPEMTALLAQLLS